MTTEAIGNTDVSYAFAKNVVNVGFEDIRADVVEHTKWDILDTLGTTIAGSSFKGTSLLLELMREIGGKPESTVLIYGDKLPAVSAALINGTMADAHDFSDAYGKGLTHAGMSTVTPAFAVAERVGRVSGKDLITAIVLGQDMALRMFLGTQVSEGILCQGINNSFGATATVGKILKLSQEEMVNAFGIAYSQVSGTLQIYYDCAMVKAMQAGIMSKTGVLSALLAQKGFTGTKNSFQGKAGLFTAYCDGNYDLEILTENLGKHFEGINIGFKPYPCGMCEHFMIDACLDLTKAHSIQPKDVDEVRVGVGEHGYRVFGEPTEAKMKPRVPCDAEFSGRYIAASAILDGKIDLDSFAEEAIRRPEVLEFMKKVDIYVDPEISRRTVVSPLAGDMALTPGRVTIKTKDGKEYEKRIDYAKGNPANPMTPDELMDKFYHCAAHSARPIQKANLQKVVELVDELELVDDVNKIMSLLVA